MMNKKAILIKFGDEDFSRIKQAAEERRLPMSTFIRMMIVRQLENNGGDLRE